MRETWFQSLGWEDPLEEGMATHSSLLAWRIPTSSRAWQRAVHGVAKDTTERLSTEHHHHANSSFGTFHPSPPVWAG